jgi:DNA repair exonuclease SbcCD ATPase subunit
MKIEIQNVEFKNFLSYGNNPQRLDFIEGINLVLGKNIESGRSNGAGKSSLIETIPFALFGKLSRPVNKAGIVNWKNGKHCEVKISFKKGDIKYTVLRAIKPDKLEIYENNSLIPIPSNVKTYQEMFENERLGFDYNTFMYLFYTNLNTNVPLLKMNTTQKRIFLERMFLLDTYTNLNSVSNEKIKGLEEKNFKQTVSIEQNEKTITDLEKQNDSLRLKLINIEPYENEIRDAKAQYLMKQKELSSTVDVVAINERIAEIETESTKLKETLDGIISTIRILESENIAKEKHIKDIKKQKDDHVIKLNNIDAQLRRDDVNIPTGYIETITSNIEKLHDDINVNTEMKLQWTEAISTHKEKKRGLEETYKSLQGGICPTCNRKLTVKQLEKEYLSKIESLTEKIIDYQIKYQKLIDSIATKTERYNELKNDLDVVRTKQKKREALLVEHKTLSEITIPTYETDEQEILLNVEKIKQFTKVQKDFILKLEEKNGDLLKHKISLEQYNENKKQLDKLSDSIEALEKELLLRKSNKIEIETIIQENIIKINGLKNTIKTITKGVSKVKELIDYLSYLKVLCKDENVKQYAISSYMSYLVQQTNFYLTEAGSSHYMKFNKWLDEEIHGPGVFDASYGNLSGGEARSIDLAIQFAFLDVGRLKTGIFPDILLLDEILDSSIDGNGLNNILKIIKTKQHEDKSKTFIITHRSEISDMDVDNTYIISKNSNGFSIIEKA